MLDILSKFSIYQNIEPSFDISKYRSFDISKYRSFDISKYRSFDISKYRNIECVLPSIPRVFFAGTERKLRVCITYRNRTYRLLFFYRYHIVSNSILVRYPTLLMVVCFHACDTVYVLVYTCCNTTGKRKLCVKSMHPQARTIAKSGFCFRCNC